MQTAPHYLSHASSGQRVGALVGLASASGTSTVLRALCESVLANGVGSRSLPSLKSGCNGQRSFGRVKSAAVCTVIGLVGREGGVQTSVATASVRSNLALKRDVPQAARPLALR